MAGRVSGPGGAGKRINCPRSAGSYDSTPKDNIFCTIMARWHHDDHDGRKGNNATMTALRTIYLHSQVMRGNGLICDERTLALRGVAN